jgi:hypothetical protein
MINQHVFRENISQWNHVLQEATPTSFFFNFVVYVTSNNWIWIQCIYIWFLTEQYSYESDRTILISITQLYMSQTYLNDIIPLFQPQKYLMNEPHYVINMFGLSSTYGTLYHNLNSFKFSVLMIFLVTVLWSSSITKYSKWATLIQQSPSWEMGLSASQEIPLHHDHHTHFSWDTKVHYHGHKILPASRSCVRFCNMLVLFYGEGLLASRPTPNSKDYDCYSIYL